VTPPSTRTTWLALVLIVAVGAVLRFYQIGIAPPGFYRDEAFYALDARALIDTGFAGLPVWFPANNGREGLFIYLLTPALGLFGDTVFAVRMTSAVIGTLTLIAVFFAGRAMFSLRIGVLSAGIMAVTFWHVAISRVGYRAITLPLLLCTSLALIFVALRTDTLRPRLLWCAAAGLSCGLTYYTYGSAQMLLPLITVYAISLWVGLRRELFNMRSDADRTIRRYGSVGAFSAGLLLALLPLLLFAARDPAVLFARAGQVSVFSPDINGGNPLGLLLQNVGRAFGMFLFEGDRIWRHNLSLRPVFEGLVGFGFLIGVVVCGWRWWRSWVTRLGTPILGVEANVAPQFVLLWLLFFLIPTVLAEDTPHFLRAIGALPAACIIAAVGLETALAFASRRGWLSILVPAFARQKLTPPAFAAALILAVTGVNTATAYFYDYVPREQTGFWLEQNNVCLAERVNTAHAAGRTVWVDARLANDNPALAFLSRGQYAPTDADKPPRTGNPFRAFIDPNQPWDAWRMQLTDGLISVRPGCPAQGDKDPAPRQAFVALTRTALPPEPAQPLARFETGPTLLDARIERDEAGAPLAVTLRWTVDTVPGEDYAVFVHFVSAGRLLTQHDGTPGYGLLPMPGWRPGDQIEDTHPLQVIGPQPGSEIRVGVYRRSDGRRLNVRDPAGNVLGDYVIIPDPNGTTTTVRGADRAGHPAITRGIRPGRAAV
jgi:4-amino-4-deoxy-L-arabinose transferase-like glycosyltransferase